MEIIYNNILDDLQDHITRAEIHNRTIKKFILTPREFGEVKKHLHRCGKDIKWPWDLSEKDIDYKILGVPFEVK